MRLFIGLLGICLLWLSCEPEPGPTPTMPPTPPPVVEQDTFSCLALGDSYTIGQGVDESERYPQQLADALVDIGTTLEPLDIVARTGWTTSDLQRGIEDRLADLRPSYDLVTLLIGVNNFYRGRTLTEYEVEFAELLMQAINFAGASPARVVVLSIPDYAYTPFGGGDPLTSQGIDNFNAANARITDSLGVAYVDVTTISRDGIAEPALVSSDQLHPSALQYQRWVEVLLPVVREALED